MFREFRKNERGAIAIIVALGMSVLLGFSALAVDVGRVALEKQDLQNALDSAALAGAQELPGSTSQASVKVKEYFAHHGFAESDITNIEYLNGNRRVRVSAEKEVAYTFARIFNNGNSKKVAVAAAAQVGNPFDSYNYALFSGSQLDLLQFTGKNTIIGDVHSNNSLKNSADITGKATAVGTIDAKINASGGTETGVAPIAMPDFSGVVDDATTLTMETLNSYGVTRKSTSKPYVMSSEQYNTIMGLYPLVYIDGDVEINGTGINASGALVTTGDITFNGGDVNMSSSVSVALCSLSGDVTFNGGKGDVNGLIYAPNGTVNLNGKGGIISGSIIADIIDSSGGVEVHFDASAANTMPATVIRLVE